MTLRAQLESLRREHLTGCYGEMVAEACICPAAKHNATLAAILATLPVDGERGAESYDPPNGRVTLLCGCSTTWVRCEAHADLQPANLSTASVAPVPAPQVVEAARVEGPIGGADYDGRCNDCGEPRPGRHDGPSWKRRVRDGNACRNPDCPQAKVRAALTDKDPVKP